MKHDRGRVVVTPNRSQRTAFGAVACAVRAYCGVHAPAPRGMLVAVEQGRFCATSVPLETMQP